MLNNILFFTTLIFSFSIADVTHHSTPLFRTTVPDVPDTLEVVILKVAFQEDTSPLTTGTGSFNTGDSEDGYALDPVGQRDSDAYWQQRFSFANAYYQNASHNQLAIKADIYPKSNSAYLLPREMLGYGRTQKVKSEKGAQYDSTRTLLYMEFIADAVTTALDHSENPFILPAAQPGTHRVYIILHAGASRFTDGASLGSSGANSPGDFIDFFIFKEDFIFLKDSPEHSSDTLGIPINLPALDTLTEIMVVSETASQDDLNWGISGILANQLGRSIGIPNTHDVVTGESKLGQFDLMDYAGYNALNGFIPVLPSAWIRTYMDWAQPLLATPDSSTTTYAIAAHGALDSCNTLPCTEILKVPLNSKEYLLIENRQRSSTYNDSLLIETIVQSVSIPYVLPYDSLAHYFTEVFSGAITGTNSFDAGIPGSGICIWHINEWLIEEFLSTGQINGSKGDTLVDHYQGIRLIEADGDFTLGKLVPGTNYGSPSDLFPHIMNNDTITTLESDGYASTQNTLNAFSNLSITIPLPANGFQEKNVTLYGDTVINFESPIMKVSVHWNPVIPPQSLWPVEGFGSSYNHALTFVSHPFISETALIRSSQTGFTQLFTITGDTITPFTQRGTVQFENSLGSPIPASSPIAEDTVIYIYATDQKPISTAALNDHLFNLYPDGILQSLHLSSTDSLIYIDSIKGLSIKCLIATSTALYIADNVGVRSVHPETFDILSTTPFPFTSKVFTPHSMALTNATSPSSIVITGTQGKTLLLDLSTQSFSTIIDSLSNANEFFTLSVSDFDRNTIPDAFILGSQGTAQIIAIDASKKSAPLNFTRTDSSSAALSDINNDGYVDIIFTGDNAIWAIDYNGAPLKGFPYHYSNTRPQNLVGHYLYPVGVIQSTPIIVDITGDSLPEILSATPDGLIYAVNNNGSLSTASYATQENKSYSSWPLTVAPVTYADTLRSPYGHLAAHHQDTTVNLFISYSNLTTAYTFIQAQANQNNMWLENSGNSQRTNYFDAHLLKQPSEKTVQSSIDSFHLFPNPITTNRASISLELGAPATQAKIIFYDIAGFTALTKELGSLTEGVNPAIPVELGALGNGIYAVLINVTFADGTTVKAWDRVGVAR